MKLRAFAALVGLMLCAGAAHAQIGLYLNPVANRISNSQVDTGVFAFLGSGNTSNWFQGVAFGGYATLAKPGNFDLGLDARGVYVRHQQAPLASFLIGPRASFPIERFHSRGYLELLGGVGRSHPATNPRSITRAQFSVLAGLDHQIAKHVDWRVLEVGYGTVGTINSTVATGGGTADFPSSTVMQLSTGLVFKF